MVWNMAIGLVFIFGGLALSAGGRIAPLAAALLHSAGTLIVVFNSARLVRAGEERSP
jgi:Cd2+/Zn2+-exporting ATPase